MVSKCLNGTFEDLDCTKYESSVRNQASVCFRYSHFNALHDVQTLAMISYVMSSKTQPVEPQKQQQSASSVTSVVQTASDIACLNVRIEFHARFVIFAHFHVI